MLTRISCSIIALPLLSVLATSCGKWAHSKRPQAINTVAIPEYPKVQDDVFSLSGKKPDITYRTTMLIINPKTDPSLLGEVVNASVFSREAFAEARAFEITNDYKNLYGDSGLEIQALHYMTNDLRNFELKSLQKNPISIERRVENARSWIAKELDDIKLSSEQRETFDTAWGSYCDAKVIELASNSIFAASSYKAVPTPQPFCAEYYESRGYFAGPSCVNPSQGNYFTCLWQEGVLKTQWFQPLPALPASATPEETAAWTSFNSAMEAKRAKLNSLLTSDPIGFQKVLALDPEKVAIQADPIRNKINPTFFVSIFTRQLVKQAGNNVVWCSIATFGIKDPSFSPLCTLFSQAPLPRSPADWIDSMEGRTQGASLVDLPAPPAPRKATTQQIMRYVGERNKGLTSESDRLFHSVLTSPKPLETPAYEGAGDDFVGSLDEIRTLLAAVLYGTFAPEDLKERVERTRNIQYRQQKIAEVKAQSKELQDQTNESIDRGLKATNAGNIADGSNVAFGFIEVRFHFKQLGQILLGEFWPKDSEVSNRTTHIFRGCYDVDQGKSVDCPSEIPGDTEGLVIYPATLTKNPDSGRIDLSMVVSEPEAVSLDTKPRVDTSTGALPNYFMDFSADEFRNKTLRFEIYSNRVDGYLDILTGKMFISAEGKDLYEGGISGWELWDY